MRRLLLLAPAIALIAAGCGSSGNKTTTAGATSTPTSTSSASISTRTISGLGAVLVNGQGKTLYVFKPDQAKKVTCTGACAAVWPPVALASGNATASGDVKASLLSSDPNPTGGHVVTYNGWPLYAYVADTAPGSARGQAVNLNGGVWYVMSPTGQPVTTKATSSSSSTTSTSSGYHYP